MVVTCSCQVRARVSVIPTCCRWQRWVQGADCNPGVALRREFELEMLLFQIFLQMNHPVRLICFFILFSSSSTESSVLTDCWAAALIRLSHQIKAAVYWIFLLCLFAFYCAWTICCLLLVSFGIWSADVLCLFVHRAGATTDPSTPAPPSFRPPCCVCASCKTTRKNEHTHARTSCSVLFAFQQRPIKSLLRSLSSAFISTSLWAPIMQMKSQLYKPHVNGKHKHVRTKLHS